MSLLPKRRNFLRELNKINFKEKITADDPFSVPKKNTKMLKILCEKASKSGLGKSAEHLNKISIACNNFLCHCSKVGEAETYVKKIEEALCSAADADFDSTTIGAVLDDKDIKKKLKNHAEDIKDLPFKLRAIENNK